MCLTSWSPWSPLPKLIINQRIIQYFGTFLRSLITCHGYDVATHQNMTREQIGNIRRSNWNFAIGCTLVTHSVCVSPHSHSLSHQCRSCLVRYCVPTCTCQHVDLMFYSEVDHLQEIRKIFHSPFGFYSIIAGRYWIRNYPLFKSEMDNSLISIINYWLGINSL